MPAELKKLNFQTDYIPEKLKQEISSYTKTEEMIEFYKNHPISKYDLSKQNIELMEKEFDNAQNIEEKSKNWFYFPNFMYHSSPLEIYLKLAERGYAKANNRLACAFEKGELGLPINKYWAAVFSSRPCDCKSMELTSADIKIYINKCEQMLSNNILDYEKEIERELNEIYAEYHLYSSERSLSSDSTQTISDEERNSDPNDLPENIDNKNIDNSSGLRQRNQHKK
jgi:hypothetical protein